jgi:hypothetical protein
MGQEQWSHTAECDDDRRDNGANIYRYPAARRTLQFQLGITCIPLPPATKPRVTRQARRFAQDARCGPDAQRFDGVEVPRRGQRAGLDGCARDLASVT